MDDLHMFWATVAVPFENYRRGQRHRFFRVERNASLVASGYLIPDPVAEVLTTPSTPKRRGRPPRGQS